MKIRIYYFLARITTVLLIVVSSCGTETEDSGEDSNVRILKKDEVALCTAQGIDTLLIKELRENCREKFEVFVPDSIWNWELDSNGEYVVRASKLHGLMYEAEQVLAQDLVTRYSADFIAKGCTMYVFEQNFSIDNEKDKVAIVSTADKYTILQESATDGINYDINNDSLISIIHDFDLKYDLILTGVGIDWCQFYIRKEPQDWNAFAEEVYAVCPDVVDQGTGSVEDLAQEMRRTNTLYLWWD